MFSGNEFFMCVPMDLRLLLPMFNYVLRVNNKDCLFYELDLEKDKIFLSFKIYEFPLKQIQNFEEVLNNCSNNYLNQPGRHFLGFFSFSLLFYLKCFQIHWSPKSVIVAVPDDSFLYFVSIKMFRIYWSPRSVMVSVSDEQASVAMSRIPSAIQVGAHLTRESFTLTVFL